MPPDLRLLLDRVALVRKYQDRVGVGRASVYEVVCSGIKGHRAELEKKAKE